MNNLSPVSLAALEALEMSIPSSPKEIPANISLADLEQIRAAWLERARAEQIPERLFEIGYWLGSESPTHYSGTHRLLESGDIRIWATITLDKRNIYSNDWNMTRRITAYADPAQSILVMDWSWMYHAESTESEPLNQQEGTDLLYVPGEWVTKALAMSSKAEQTRIGIAHSAEVAERDALAWRLLVGREV